jgi:serine/threonine-protein kinase
MRTARALLVASLCAVWSPFARADDASNKAAAQALFEEGLRLFDAGRYPDACEKFAVSQRLDAAASTLLNLARCYERAGRTASAWVTYGEAAAQAHREADPRREQFARERVADSAKRLSRLSIAVPTAPNGVVVKRDGSPVDRAEWGVAVPVDPGPHVVEASAPSKRAWRTTVDVAKSPSTATVEVPKLPDAVGPDANAPVVETHQAPAPPDRGGGQRIAGIAAVSVGVIGLGVGTFMGLRASSLLSDSKSHCPQENACDATGVGLNHDAGHAADIATVAFIAGGAALVVGAVLWLTAPRAAPRVGLAPQGATIRF